MNANGGTPIRIRLRRPLRDAAGPMTTCPHVEFQPARCPVGGSACPRGSGRCRPLEHDEPAAADQRADVGAPGEELPPVRELEGRTLRYFLTLTMVDAGRELTVKDLARALAARGCGVAGRTSKVVSDCLRWEVRRGRVVRVSRGTYAAARFPRQTEAWMRTKLREALERPPRPVRSWPVGGWRVGWSSQARGRELATARARRRAFRKAAREQAFAIKSAKPSSVHGAPPCWLRTWFTEVAPPGALPAVGVRRRPDPAAQQADPVA